MPFVSFYLSPQIGLALVTGKSLDQPFRWQSLKQCFISSHLSNLSSMWRKAFYNNIQASENMEFYPQRRKPSPRYSALSFCSFAMFGGFVSE